MNESQLVECMRVAIDNSGWQKGFIAESLHIEQSNISMWLNRSRHVPVDLLVKLVDLLDDFEFRCVAAEFLTGVHVISTDKDYLQDAQTRFFTSKYKESEWHAMDDEITLLLGKERTARTEQDKYRVIAYLQKLDSALKEGRRYQTSIMKDWGLLADNEDL